MLTHRPGRIRRASAVAAIAATGLLLTACTSGGNNDVTPTDAGQGTASALQMVDAKMEGPAVPPDAPEGTKYMVTVKIKSGITWSDGSPLTAKDFVGGYNLMWTYYEPTWNNLLDVRALDDTTIQFFLSDLNTGTLRSLLRANQTGATSQFKDLFDRAEKARKAGLAQDSAEVSQIVADIDEIAKGYKEQISYGPFKLDKISATQVTMVKNPGGFAADTVPGDSFVVDYGTSQQSLPLLLSDSLDFTRDAYSASDLSALSAQRTNIKIISTPTGTGPSIWFNQSKPLFKDAEFRQAVAYVVDRARVATVALGDQARPAETMSGFPDTLNDTWLDETTKGTLDPYSPSTEKATTLLTGLGLKQADGKWTDASGDPVAFAISVPTDFPDFLAAARDISEQLNAFGFDTTVKGIASSARGDVIKQADYDTLIDFGFQADAGQPALPSSSYSYYMLTGYFGSNNPEATDGAVGMNWPTTQTDPLTGKSVEIADLVAGAQAGLDQAEQKKPIQSLAAIYNKELPVVTLYERFTTDPIADGPRVTGWLPAEDPLYRNYSTSDNYVAIQLLSGVLKKAEGSDGTIRTATTYAQPPNAGLGFYSLNSIQQSFNSPTFHMTFPPLFWYVQDNGTYSSTGGVGESYSISEATG